jgi:hypothetical protein
MFRQLLFEPSSDRRWQPGDEASTRERSAHGLGASMDLVNLHRVEVYDAAEACWHWIRIVRLGFGDEPDAEQARLWLERAASLGQADALQALARSDRADDNMDSFETHLRAAAAEGHPSALHDLGYALYSGVLAGGEDVDGAIEAYRAAAGPDHPSTATDLSFVLEDVPGQDAATESIRWLNVAATAGDVAALRRLGERCRDGEGVERDVAAATRWFLTAYYLGWDEAIDTITPLVHKLEPAEIAAADRVANGSGYAASVLIGTS